MAPAESLCHLGLAAESCVRLHVATAVPQGISGSRNNRLCPCHDDRTASLSINAGKKGMRVVWCCGAGCDPADIRAELLGRGVHESCLGRYGLPKRTIQPGMRIIGQDAALVADSKRLRAIEKLPRMASGLLYRMCIQAILEGDGDLPSDPLLLVPVNRDDFLALAKRAGIERKYRYQLYERWLKTAP